MQNELFVLRHSKSDWSQDWLDDHERPLNDRGQRDAKRMAKWLQDNGLRPDKVICSTALRTRQTLQPIIAQLKLNDESVQYEHRLYLASLISLLDIIQLGKPHDGILMIVGHNPGLDELVSYLANTPPPLTHSGKLMTTTCLARFKMPPSWERLDEQAQLISITRPGDIAK